MMARKAAKLVTAGEQLEELTPEELAEVSGGFGYGYGMPSHGFPYGRGYGYGGGYRHGYGVPFYGRPRYHRFYHPYI